MHGNTIARRLSAAVLAGSVLLTAGTAGAGAALAAPSAPAAQQQELTKANAYELAKKLIQAKTVGEASKL